MLSRIFNQQTLSILTTVFLLTAIGCASKTVDLATWQDHPANANAQQGVSVDHDNIPTREMHEGNGGHGSAELSPEGTEALAVMLDTYLAIGNQLASDTMEDVNAKAHAMLEAFHTIEHETPAELWSAHESRTETIHNAGHELGDLSDIKAARIAYGSLSDSFKHFIAAVGVPANYEKPIRSYICGMAPDVPQGGIWLQTGESVRNPYFGSAMLRCHSAKMQMSVSSADMFSAEDMESHKHSLGEEFDK